MKSWTEVPVQGTRGGPAGWREGPCSPGLQTCEACSPADRQQTASMSVGRTCPQIDQLWVSCSPPPRAPLVFPLWLPHCCDAGKGWLFLPLTEQEVPQTPPEKTTRAAFLWPLVGGSVASGSHGGGAAAAGTQEVPRILLTGIEPFYFLSWRVESEQS